MKVFQPENKRFSKIFGSILFIIFSLLIIYILYKKIYFYKGIHLPNFFFYLTLSILGIFISIVIFFLQNSTSIKLFLVFFSTVFITYVFEYSMNYINIKDGFRIKLANEKNISYDTRTIFEVHKDLKKKYGSASIGYPVVGYVNPDGIKINKERKLPLAGISNSSTVVCNETGKWSIYKSDRYGFNNSNELWDYNLIDVILIGDSYLHGDCVDPNDNISEKLISKSNLKILNLGFRGNSPYMQLASLIEYGLEKKPKNIFMFFSEENDFSEIARDKDKEILTNYLNDDYSQNLINFQLQIDKNLKKIHKKNIYLRNIKLQNIRLNLINKVKAILINPKEEQKINHIPNKNSTMIYKKIIEKINSISKINNINFSIVYLPSYERYRGDNYSELFRIVETICDDLSINLININKDVFEKQNDPMKLFPFNIYSHYNEKAYELIADVLFKNLRNFN